MFLQKLQLFYVIKMLQKVIIKLFNTKYKLTSIKKRKKQKF